MQKLTAGKEQVQVQGRTIREIIAELETAFPGIGARLCEEDGIRPGIAVAVDGEIVPEGMRRKVAPKSEVHFLPAIGGG